MKTNNYPKIVFFSEADAGYIAIAPDLPGCSAFGSTEAEAIEELSCAVHAWIIACISAGNPVPDPSDPWDWTVTHWFKERISDRGTP